MRRSLLHGHAHWGAALALALLCAAGCGGDAGIGTHPPGPGPRVDGRVELPNGDLARAPSFWRRVASSLVRRAQALVVDNLAPAGPNVSVLLLRIDPGDVVDGEIAGGDVLSETFTDGSGRYEFELPTNTDADTCRFLVQVGSTDDGTLTRAFVYSTDSSIDINVQSEAAVRLILAEIGAGRAGLCDFSAAEIAAIYEAIDRSDAVASGDTVEALNASGEAAAGADPDVQAAIAAALPPPPPSTATATPTALASATPTSTSTPQTVVTVTRTASRTATGEGTSTPTVTPSRTAGRPSRTVANTATPTATTPPAGTATNTVEITPTGTATPTSTSEASSTATPTSTPTEQSTTTPTATPTPSTSASPTATRTASATATLSATLAASATASATRSTTNTPTRTPTHTRTTTATSTSTRTATATPPPPGGVQLNVGAFGATPGILAGTAGAILDVPVSLVTNGASVSAVSNDLVYDSAMLDVETVGGSPDCTVDAALAGGKEIVARVAALDGTMKRLRVGLFGDDNQAELDDGNLYRCRFLIAVAASGTVALDNVPGASSPQGAEVAAGGADGSVTIAGGGATLALGSGTAAAGAMIDVVASLAPNGAQLSAVATDIRFDSTRVDVVEEGGAPDCTVDESIGEASQFDKEVFAAVRDAEEPGIRVLRVGVVSPRNNEVLPDIGTPLAVFRCRFTLGEQSGDVVLGHSAGASDPSGLEVGLSSLPGAIGVE